MQPVSEAEADSYATFMRAFDLGGKTQEIATLLKDDPVVTKIHTHLVSPPTVTRILTTNYRPAKEARNSRDCFGGVFVSSWRCLCYIHG